MGERGLWFGNASELDVQTRVPHSIASTHTQTSVPFGRNSLLHQGDQRTALWEWIEGQDCDPQSRIGSFLLPAYHNPFFAYSSKRSWPMGPTSLVLSHLAKQGGWGHGPFLFVPTLEEGLQIWQL